MTVPWVTVVGVALLGCMFTGIGGYRWLREHVLRRSGVRTSAVVAGNSEDPDVSEKDARAERAPVLEFTTADGNTVHARLGGIPYAPLIPPGRALTVFYHPRRPSTVAIAGHGRGLARVMVGIGLMFFAVVAMLLLAPEGLLARLPHPTLFMSAIPFLGLGGYGVARAWSLRLRGGRADGVVVGETIQGPGNTLPLFHPVVRFRDPNGYEIESVSERGRTGRRLDQGQAVQIRYDSNDVYRIALSGDGPRPMYSFTAALGLCCLALIVASLLPFF